MGNVIEILDIVIWPVVILIGMFLFRKDFSRALKRISSVETSVAKMMFKQEMEDVEQSMQDLDINGSQKNNGWLDEMLKIAELNPRAAIIEAWTAIEIACIKLGLVQGASVRTHFSPGALENYLKSIPNFDNDLIIRVMDLRKLRNRVTHGIDEYFEFIDAKKYIQIADKTLNILNEKNT